LIPNRTTGTYWKTMTFIAALRHDGIIRSFPEEQVERIFGLAFALEQIGRHLDELADRVREIAASG